MAKRSCFRNENERALRTFLAASRLEREQEIYFDPKTLAVRERETGDSFLFGEAEALTLDLAASFLDDYRSENGLAKLDLVRMWKEMKTTGPTEDAQDAVKQSLKSLLAVADPRVLGCLEDRETFLSCVRRELVNLELIAKEARPLV
jgi:hypothetical protein